MARVVARSAIRAHGDVLDVTCRDAGTPQCEKPAEAITPRNRSFFHGFHGLKKGRGEVAPLRARAPRPDVL